MSESAGWAGLNYSDTYANPPVIDPTADISNVYVPYQPPPPPPPTHPHISAQSLGPNAPAFGHPALQPVMPFSVFRPPTAGGPTSRATPTLSLPRLDTQETATERYRRGIEAALQELRNSMLEQGEMTAEELRHAGKRIVFLKAAQVIRGRNRRP